MTFSLSWVDLVKSDYLAHWRIAHWPLPSCHWWMYQLGGNAPGSWIFSYSTAAKQWLLCLRQWKPAKPGRNHHVRYPQPYRLAPRDRTDVDHRVISQGFCNLSWENGETQVNWILCPGSMSKLLRCWGLHKLKWKTSMFCKISVGKRIPWVLLLFS